MNQSSSFGDIRLDRRQNDLVNAMITRQEVIINQLAKNRSELIAYHRFLENEKVTTDKIISCFTALNPIDYSGKHLLMIQDTSDLGFNFNTNRGNMGFLAPNTSKTGFRLHPCITFDANTGACYNLASSEIHTNDYNEITNRIAEGLPKPVNQSAFKDKQSFRWYSAAEKAISNSPHAASYTIVADKEADIYDAIARFKANQWDYLIRSGGHRRVECSNGDTLLLTECLKRWKVEFSYYLNLAKTDKRTAHQAHLMVKFGKTSLLKPNNHPDKTLADQEEVFVIEVKEDPETVVNNEKPIHWILITSHPIENQEQALHFIQCYCWRWVIEQIFRTLKSKGLNIEESELEDQDQIEKQTVLALIASVQVLQLVQARDGKTKQDLKQIFNDVEIQCLQQLNQKLEGKTEKQKNPHKPTSLAFASWVIARLGGWKGYQGKARPPGPITMKNGLIRFYSILEGYYLLL